MSPATVHALPTPKKSQPGELARMVAIALIDESPTNQRQTFPPGPMNELADSIRAHGILQPLVVRPKADRFELVFGHRRRRAAKAAGLKEAPAFVREYADDHVIELQLIENVQREGVSPLEEASGYKMLRDGNRVDAEGPAQPAKTVAEISKAIGKSVGHISERLKLLELEGAALEALKNGRITASVAVLLARYGAPKLQAEGLKRVLRPGDEPMSFRDAKDQLSEFDEDRRRREKDSTPKAKEERKKWHAANVASHAKYAEYRKAQDAEWKKRDEENKRARAEVEKRAPAWLEKHAAAQGVFLVCKNALPSYYPNAAERRILKKYGLSKVRSSEAKISAQLKRLGAKKALAAACELILAAVQPKKALWYLDGAPAVQTSERKKPTAKKTARKPKAKKVGRKGRRS